jgi:hypothetical protein
MSKSAQSMSYGALGQPGQKGKTLWRNDVLVPVARRAIKYGKAHTRSAMPGASAE